MMNRELETRYKQMKLMWKNLVDANVGLVDENKMLKEEIERLNQLISQREKKWEKWTTEKTILSTKMSDYLCRYQNIKREYTKQIKISTDRKKEIERLNNIIKHTDSWIDRTIEIIKQPSEDDTWILERLNGIKQCLKGSE